jgi:hypothetical protein
MLYMYSKVCPTLSSIFRLDELHRTSVGSKGETSNKEIQVGKYESFGGH